MQDLAGIGPVERPSQLTIPPFRESKDRVGELANTREGTIPEAFGREDAEPDLDLVEPASVERREDEREAGVSLHPCLHVGMSSCVDVVADHDDRTSAIVGGNVVEEVQDPGNLPVCCYLDEYVSGSDIERGEDVAGAVAAVFELDSSNVAGASRLVWELARESLDTWLLVDAQDRLALRRPDVKRADSARFGVELGILRIQPVPNPVRLERHLPEEATDRRAADAPAVALLQEAGEFADRPAAELDADVGRRLDDERRDLLPNLRLDHRWAPPTRPVLEGLNTTLVEPLAPATDDLTVYRQRFADGLDTPKHCREQHDLGSLDQPVVGSPSPNDSFQTLAMLFLELDPVLGYRSSHPLRPRAGCSLGKPQIAHGKGVVYFLTGVGRSWIVTSETEH